ncbi:MAG: glycosyltransferase [Synechococcales cyanobacterium C42_A2020_086]|jgi:glycosyltransferase involved in cell wall biosynthesis|nr:glycosyltransferase [Synechococcales cyanobacterium C42_A2020_086]
MNILMLSSTFPYPPSRGGTEIRTFNLLKFLSQRHTITLVTQRHRDVSDAEVEALRAAVAELVVFPLAEPPQVANPIRHVAGQTARWLQSWLSSTPPNVLFRYSLPMQAWITTAVNSGQYDVITCEHSVNEIYINPRWRQQLKTVVDVHSSIYAWTRNHLEMNASPHPWRDRLYLPLLHRYEQRYAAKFSQIVVTTEDDRQEMQRLCPAAEIAVIPNGVDLELFPYRSNDPCGMDLVFVGAMDASHNIDAARFFVLEVMPLLRQRYPSITFRIVGARPTPEVLALQSQPGVMVTGKVPSMVEQLHKATVCVVPLRTGFGIKNKTLEAMAAGVPVVGSDRGLEGLAVDGKGVPLRALRANSPAEYGAAISRLLESPALRTQLSQAGRDFVEQEYTWERAGTAYERVLAHSHDQEAVASEVASDSGVGSSRTP